jgi:peptidoglycan hydrolase-like protein with peptidoglycan-binding domain
MGKYLAVLVIFVSGAMLVGCQKKSAQNDLMPAEEMMDNRMMAPENQEMATEMTDTTSTTDAVTDTTGAITAAEQTATDAMTAAAPTLPTPHDIQTALKNAGYYNGNIDGTIGPKTKQAIKDFQFKNNLSSDGKVGPKTWSKLSQYLTAGATTTTQAPTETTTVPDQGGY